MAAGQASNSPAIDAGSGAVSTRDISGSTRTDGVDDAGVADLGIHANAAIPSGAPPATAFPATYYVATTGSDTRSKLEAQSPATPWKTIGRAMSINGAAANDAVVVAPGTYNEAVVGPVVEPILDDVTEALEAEGATVVEGMDINMTAAPNEIFALLCEF